MDDKLPVKTVKLRPSKICAHTISIIACWVQDWLMSLNLSECDHLTITNKRNPINSFYKLNDQILCQVAKAKYLGVTINQTLCLGIITM